MEEELKFLRAQNEFFKETIAKQHNELILLRAALEQAKKQEDEKAI